MTRGAVLVMVGTHHRPFPRLVSWADSLAASGLDVLVQHGTSAPPQCARGVVSLSRAQMDDISAGLGAVVCQGGPSLMMEWLRRGHMPIVVPRDPALGEHIDDHQQRFADFMARRGWVRLAGDYTGLRALVVDHLNRGDAVSGIQLPDTAASVAAFAALAQKTGKADAIR